MIFRLLEQRISFGTHKKGRLDLHIQSEERDKVGSRDKYHKAFITLACEQALLFGQAK